MGPLARAAPENGASGPEPGTGTAPAGRVGPGRTVPARVAVRAKGARAARRWRVDGPPSGAVVPWRVRGPRAQVLRGPGSVGPVAARALRGREAREGDWEQAVVPAARRA
ncbi:MAG: hypothetical protein ABSE77_00430 [Acidimicrobiales bacterium]